MNQEEYDIIRKEIDQIIDKYDITDTIRIMTHAIVDITGKKEAIKLINETEDNDIHT